MEDDRTSSEIDFKTLIFKQLNRIGELCASPIEFEKKQDAIFISVLILDSFVPNSLKDKNSDYFTSISKIKDSFKGKHVLEFSNAINEAVNVLAPLIIETRDEQGELFEQSQQNQQ